MVVHDFRLPLDADQAGTARMAGLSPSRIASCQRPARRKRRVFRASNRYNSPIMNGRQFLYVLYQTTRATYLAQEKNSALGLVWHLLNPLLMTAVLFLVFRNVDFLRGIEHYQLYILVG